MIRVRLLGHPKGMVLTCTDPVSYFNENVYPRRFYCKLSFLSLYLGVSPLSPIERLSFTIPNLRSLQIFHQLTSVLSEGNRKLGLISATVSYEKSPTITSIDQSEFILHSPNPRQFTVLLWVYVGGALR